MIAIKVIYMPSGCMDCKFLDLDPSGAYCSATNNCRFIGGGADQYETHRPDWCPLVEVKKKDDEIR